MSRRGIYLSTSKKLSTPTPTDISIVLPVKFELFRENHGREGIS